MIPIAIPTRNRHKYLDVTLRSLSATNLPADQVIIVFDDASDDKETMKYLHTDETVELHQSWQGGPKWHQIGLGTVVSRSRGPGLKGRVEVIRLGDTKSGVVNASCQAITQLYERFPADIDANGMLLIQDDVVFNDDWLGRMLAQSLTADEWEPVGMLAGACINRTNKKRESPTFVPERGITAQCNLLTPAGLFGVLPWAQKWHDVWTGFDNKLCAAVRRGGAGVYRCYPAVCQHIGIVSGVRPSWKWRRMHPKGRIDYSAKGPYPLAADVRAFLGDT